MENTPWNAPRLWAKGKQQEKNLRLIFTARITGVNAPVLTLAAENMYQVWCYDRFVAFGPARAADGYSLTGSVPAGFLLWRMCPLTVKIMM